MNLQSAVFLWLPTPSSLLFTERRQVIGRMRLWMDGAVVTYAGHIPEGMGRMRLESEWNDMPREKRPGNLYHSLSYKSFSPVSSSIYKDLIPIPNSLESLADLALSKWLTRI